MLLSWREGDTESQQSCIPVEEGSVLECYPCVEGMLYIPLITSQVIRGYALYTLNIVSDDQWRLSNGMCHDGGEYQLLECYVIMSCHNGAT